MLRDYFKEHKLFVLLFVLFSVILIGINACTHRSLMFYIPSTFIQILEQQDNYVPFFSYSNLAIKKFSDFLIVLPYNILVPFIPDIPLNKIDLFAFSAHFSLLCALLLNYFIAKRTKRYDIVACAFAFYALFYIINSVSHIEEIHMTIMLQFILLQYFLTREKLSVYDYLIVGTTSVLCMASHETQFFFGIMLFVFTFLYAKKNPQNLKLKYFIGFSGLLMAILCMILLYPYYINFLNYINEFNGIKGDIFVSSIFFSALGIFLIILTAILGRGYRSGEWKKIIFILLQVAIFLWMKTHFEPYGSESTCYTFSLIFSIPIMFLLLLSDLFNFTEKHNYFFSNIVLISCVIGFIQIVIQINSCWLYSKYVNTFKYRINNATESFIPWKEDGIANSYAKDDYCIDSEIRSLYLTDKMKIHTLMVNNKKTNCPVTDMSVTADSIIINGTYIPIKNSYWDFSDIIPEIQKYKQMTESQQNSEK